MIQRKILAISVIALLAGCAGRPIAQQPAAPAKPIEVGILAINDFHGNLQPPRLSWQARQADGSTVAVPAGGAAYLASAIATLRKGHAHSITVGAGDLTSASPLISSLFLDEPTVTAMNAIGLDLNAAGNHEFDRGTDELKRLQNGGCDQHVIAKPCQLEPFAGARYRYLAGNTITASGDSLLPGTAIRSFGEGAEKVTIGFIGLTTRTTATLVSPSGIQGIHFADEAETANKLVPGLRAAGADLIVLLIHEGGYPKPETDPNACDGLTGVIREIADKLDPAIGVVISGHTHKAYICDYPRPGAPLLLTSAGRYGALVTDMTLRFDPASHRLIERAAHNVIVQGEAYTNNAGAVVALSDAAPRFAADPAVAAIVDRYAAAAGPLGKRVVGSLSRPPEPRESPNRKPYNSELGNLIADAQLASASTAATGGAQISFMNPFGVRADLKPAADGTVSFGDIYAMQPFGNTLMVREYSGAQLRALLEQQFDPATKGQILNVAGMRYAFDRSRPAGQHVIDPMVGGRPLDDKALYRVAISNFLAAGGDGFSAFGAGRDVTGGMLDVDAMEAYLAAHPRLAPPGEPRIIDRTPRDWTAPANP
jgi:5'-nucleotidase